MNVTRLQFETRYTPLLNFQDEYKTVFNRYLALKDVKYVIFNQGTINEALKLTFEDSYFEIEIRFDRVIFRYEAGELSDLARPTSTIKMHFDITEKLSGFSSFDKFLANSLVLWNIKPLEVKDNKIIADFKSHYLSSIPSLIEKPSDFLIRIESDTDTINSSINFGPYSPKDFKKHQFSIMNSDYSNSFKKAYGIMAISQVTNKENACGHDVFLRLCDQSKSLTSKLDEIYDSRTK